MFKRKRMGVEKGVMQQSNGRCEGGGDLRGEDRRVVVYHFFACVLALYFFRLSFKSPHGQAIVAARL